jgi:AraC-like DNA-binding protein
VTADGGKQSGLESGAVERLESAVAELICAIDTALSEDRPPPTASVWRAAELLGLISGYLLTGESWGLRPTKPAPFLGGFAPWLARKITVFIDANLESCIRVTDLAALAKLSTAHFSRSFSKTFDETPHVYLIRRRIERAQRLMLRGTSPLSQIAAECGLSDQAHLTRLFKRFVGETPSTWRRAHMTAR